MRRALPGSEYYGGSAPPQAAQPTTGPARATALATRQAGRPGTVPVFTAIRSPKEEPGSAPAASLQVRRRPSPQPPGHRLHDSRRVPHQVGARRSRPRSVRFEPVRALRGVKTPVPRVLLSGLLTGPTPSDGPGAPRLCQDCSRQPQRLPEPAVLSSSQAAATARRWWPLTSTRISSTSRRTKAALNALSTVIRKSGWVVWFSPGWRPPVFQAGGRVFSRAGRVRWPGGSPLFL
jgi:hypothetical protein